MVEIRDLRPSASLSYPEPRPATDPSADKVPAELASELVRLRAAVEELARSIQSLDARLSSDWAQKDSRPESRMTISYYFAMKLIPMAIAGMAIYLGYRLFVLGVSGQASLIVDAKGIEAQLVNAAPGLFFAVGGVAALAISIWKGVKLTIGPPNAGQDLTNAPRANKGLS